MVNLNQFKPAPTPAAAPTFTNPNIDFYGSNRQATYKMLAGLLIKISAFMVIVGAFVFSRFIYIDVRQGCYIAVQPSYTEFNNAEIVSGLKILKYAAPKDYKQVCERVSVISPNIGCGGIHGGCFYSDSPRKIYVNSSNRDLITTAAIIVHEACHAQQHFDNRSIQEQECYVQDDNIMKTIVQF